MEASKSWKFEQQELCNFILSLRIIAAATTTTLRMEFLHKHLAAEVAAAVQEIALSLSLSLYSFNCIHEYWWVPTIYCCFLIELLAPGCIPNFKLFDVFLAISHLDWPMTKKILKLWVLPQVEVCTPEIELLKCFPFATPKGRSFSLLWFVKFISSPNGQPLSCTFGIVGKPLMSWCALRWFA